MSKKACFIAVVCLIFMAASSSQAAWWTDNSGVDHLWSTNANWNNSTPPTSAATADFLRSAYPGRTDATLNSAGAVCSTLKVKDGGLNVVSGGSLTVYSWVDVGGYVGTVNPGLGTMTISGTGSVTWASTNTQRLYVGNYTDGLLTMQDSATLTLPKAVFQLGTQYGGDAEVRLYGGTIDCNDFYIYTTDPCRTNKMDITGGTLNVRRDVVDRINGYNGSRITAYGGRGTLNVSLAGNVTTVTATSRLGYAWNPSPDDNEINLLKNVTLTWSPGDWANKHDVYIGADFNDVNDANTATSNIYIGRYSTTTYNANSLSLGQAYYWRIDEVNETTSTVWKGDVWKFQTKLIADADFNGDLFVDLKDYAKLANVWLMTSQSPDFNSIYDLVENNSIDFNDLAMFCEQWLWQTSIDVQIDVNLADVQHNISPYLMGVGINTVYDSDQRWADGTIATRLIEMNTTLLRYPDTSKPGWHWQECPGAPAWKDSWETDPSSEYYFADHSVCTSNDTVMDIDEFIYWCNVIGAEPLITVNIHSGWRYNRLNDSLNETIALMQHCKTNDYQVKFWMLGNEPFEMTAVEMANIVNMFVPAMKAVDPNIKIIFNLANHLHTSWIQPKWDEFMSLAGHNIDYGDVHPYWRWQNSDDPTENMAVWSNFLKDNPITLEFQPWATPLYTYDEDINYFRQRYQAYDVGVTFSEWNAGPLYNLVPRSHFQTAMIQCEMMMQFMKGNLFAASRWPGSFASAQGNREYIDPVTFEPRPVHTAMTLFGDALGQKFIGSSSSVSQIPSIAVLSADGTKLFVYAVNKTDITNAAQIDTGSSHIKNAEVVSLGALGGDVWSNEAIMQPQKAGFRGQSVYTVLPAYSFVKITIDLTGSN